MCTEHTQVWCGRVLSHVPNHSDMARKVISRKNTGFAPSVTCPIFSRCALQKTQAWCRLLKVVRISEYPRMSADKTPSSRPEYSTHGYYFLHPTRPEVPLERQGWNTRVLVVFQKWVSRSKGRLFCCFRRFGVAFRTDVGGGGTCSLPNDEGMVYSHLAFRNTIPQPAAKEMC